MQRWSMVVLGLLATAGCGKHSGSYSAVEAERAAQAEIEKRVEAADALWAERVEEDKLMAAIDAYKAVLEADANNRHALHRLTRAFYFHATGFPPEDNDEKIARLDEAIQFGTRCIGQNEQIANAIEVEGEKERDAVQFATAEDVPCLYWTASALGQWGRASGIAKTLKHIPTVKAYMTKIEELDASFFNHGPARYWGAYYSVLPSFAGRDTDKSAEYFATSLKEAPHYLPTKYLRADTLAVAIDDAKMFTEDLMSMIQTAPDLMPEADITPENIREQIKAQKLLAERSELFSKKAIEAAGPLGEIPELTPPSPPKMDEEAEMAEGEMAEGEMKEGETADEGPMASDDSKDAE
ncbi:MAG: TRAP transporter TatT component family protein [Myxococcota bacterium]